MTEQQKVVLTEQQKAVLTEQQKAVLIAAVDLVNGGQDMEEALGCYRVISQYVLNTVPPDAETLNAPGLTE